MSAYIEKAKQALLTGQPELAKLYMNKVLEGLIEK